MKHILCEHRSSLFLIVAFSVANSVRVYSIFFVVLSLEDRDTNYILEFKPDACCKGRSKIYLFILWIIYSTIIGPVPMVSIVCSCKV